MNKITSFKQIKEIIEPIPAELFQTEYYGHSARNWFQHDETTHNVGEEDDGRSCFLGHIHRHFDPDDPRAEGDYGGYGARSLTEQFLMEKHGLSEVNGAHVNNAPDVNGYTEPVIKDRLMHMINDGIAWEEEKQAKTTLDS
jgi:hypothetical protein